jgi:hypothetical protein
MAETSWIYWEEILSLAYWGRTVVKKLKPSSIFGRLAPREGPSEETVL